MNLKAFLYPKMNYCPQLVSYANLSTDLGGIHAPVCHAFHIACVQKELYILDLP